MDQAIQEQGWKRSSQTLFSNVSKKIKINWPTTHGEKEKPSAINILNICPLA